MTGEEHSERLTAIIGFRVYPSLKVQLYEEAAARGKTLSEFIYQCIEVDWEKLLIEEDVKQQSVKEE